MRLPGGGWSLALFLAVLALARGAPGAAETSPSSAPERHRVVFGADARFPPYAYREWDGTPAGFDVELVRELGREANVEIEVRLDSWDAILSGLGEGRIDLVCLSWSDERHELYAWLGQTWTLHQSVLFPGGRGRPPGGIHELRGETIATEDRSLAQGVLAGLPPAERPHLLMVGAQAEAVGLLEARRATGVAGNSLTLRFEAARRGLTGLTELPIGAVPYGFATLKGREKEFEWVASSLEKLRRQGVLESLAEKFLSAPPAARSWRESLLLGLLLLAGVLVLSGAFFAWNGSLRREVAARTRALEATLAQKEALARSLRTNEDRYRAFLGLSSEGVARFDLESPLSVDAPDEDQVRLILSSARLSECNEAFVRLLDRPRGEALVGLRLDELLPPGEMSEGLRLFVRRGYALVGREFPRPKADGTLVWMSVGAVGIVESHRLTSVWISQRDVTARKLAEEDLRRKGRILEAVAFSSAGFLEPGRWEESAPAVLGQLAESVEASSAYVFENYAGPEGPGTRLRQEWVVSGLPALEGAPGIERMSWASSEFSPWSETSLASGQSVSLLARDFPPEGVFRRAGFTSLLLVPIFVEGRWWGQLGFGEHGGDRRWSASEMDALRAAANSLGAALAREASERALRESEERFRGLAAAAFEAIAVTDQGVFIDGNDQLGDMLGWDVTELRGQSVVAFVAPEDRARVAAHLAAGGYEPYAHRALRRDGTVFPVEVRPRPLPYKGRTARVSALLDITDRVRAEEALRSSEKKYRDIFEFAPVGIYQAGRDGTLMTANNRFAEMLGYASIDEVLGLRIGPDIYLDFPDPARVLELHESDTSGGFEARFRKKDGTALWAQIAGRVTRDTEGNTLYVEGFTRDVSERKRAEAERDHLYVQVERSAAEWQRTFDSVDSALMILDGEGRILRLNRAGRALLALSYKDILGRTLAEIGSDILLRKAAEVIEAVRTTKASVTAQARDEKGTHTWDLAAGLATLQHASDVRVILVVTDITRMIALQESLRRSETMSTLGSLVAGVAHEVRNPLFSISATLDAFDAEFGAREEYRDYAKLLRSQVVRLTQLMRDLLDYGKPPVTALKPAELRDAIRRGIRAAASLARDRGVVVKEEVRGSLPALVLDMGRMEQVFENLVANAIQHSTKGGRVRVLSRVEASDGEGARVVSSVEDEGGGIESIEVARVFEPFFSRRKGGTGLGLSIVQRIIEAHGGTVTAANRPEGGAVFTVVLPVRGAGEGGKQGG